ncbi:MAG: hypothetical protein R3A47_08560 [Polyangiales bacterium]
MGLNGIQARVGAFVLFAMMTLVGVSTPQRVSAQATSLYTTHTAKFDGVAPYPAGNLTNFSTNIAGGYYESTAASGTVRSGCMKLGANVPSPSGSFVDWSYVDFNVDNISTLNDVTIEVYACTAGVAGGAPIFTQTIAAADLGACTSPHPYCSNSGRCDAVNLGGLTNPEIDVRMVVNQSSNSQFRWKNWTVAGRWQGQVGLNYIGGFAPGPDSNVMDATATWELSYGNEALYYPEVSVDFNRVNGFADGATTLGGLNNDSEHTYAGQYYQGPTISRVAGSVTGGADLLTDGGGSGIYANVIWDFGSQVDIDGFLNPGVKQQSVGAVMNERLLEGRYYQLPLELTHGRYSCDGSD